MKNIINSAIMFCIGLAVIVLTSAADLSAGAAITAGLSTAMLPNLYIDSNQAWLDGFIQWLGSPKSSKFLATQFRGIAANNPLITEETIRMEYKLGTTSTIRFNPNKSKSNVRKSEKLLEENCTFWPQYIRHVVQKEDYTPSTEGGGHTTENTCIGDRMPFTYPDPAYFNGPKEYRELQRIWNSCLSLKTGRGDRLTNYDLDKTLYVPCCQFEPAAEGGTPKFPAYGPTMEERGFAKLNIPMPLFGGDTNEFTIELIKPLTEASIGGDDECGIKSCNVSVLELCGFKFSGTADELCVLAGAAVNGGFVQAPITA